MIEAYNTLPELSYIENKFHTNKHIPAETHSISPWISFKGLSKGSPHDTQLRPIWKKQNQIALSRKEGISKFLIMGRNIRSLESLQLFKWRSPEHPGEYALLSAVCKLKIHPLSPGAIRWQSRGMMVGGKGTGESWRWGRRRIGCAYISGEGYNGIIFSWVEMQSRCITIAEMGWGFCQETPRHHPISHTLLTSLLIQKYRKKK